MFLGEAVYQKTLFYLDHPDRRPPLLAELDCWGRETLGIPILNLICDQVRAGKDKQRLVLVSWDREEIDAHVMLHEERYYGFDPAVQWEAAQRFSSLVRNDPAFKDYWDPEGFFVVFDTLRDDIQRRVLEEARLQLEELAVGDVWRVSPAFGAIHIFFETDAQLREHEADGRYLELRQRCGAILALYDTRKVFDGEAPCVFSSRQTLTEKYDGNMFYYFR